MVSSVVEVVEVVVVTGGTTSSSSGSSIDIGSGNSGSHNDRCIEVKRKEEVLYSRDAI